MVSPPKTPQREARMFGCLFWRGIDRRTSRQTRSRRSRRDPEPRAIRYAKLGAAEREREGDPQSRPARRIRRRNPEPPSGRRRGSGPAEWGMVAPTPPGKDDLNRLGARNPESPSSGRLRDSGSTLSTLRAEWGDDQSAEPPGTAANARHPEGVARRRRNW